MQFFTCLVILFACEVAAGIWGFVNKDQVSLGPWGWPVQLGGREQHPLLGWGTVRLRVLLGLLLGPTGRKATEALGGVAWGGLGAGSVLRAREARPSLRGASPPQIAKDVKQFYDQALQQAVVDDEANNAKAVVKTFHETVRAGGQGAEDGEGGALRDGAGGGAEGWGEAGGRGEAWPQLRPREQEGPGSPAPQGPWAPL